MQYGSIICYTPNLYISTMIISYNYIVGIMCSVELKYNIIVYDRDGEPIMAHILTALENNISYRPMILPSIFHDIMFFDNATKVYL